MCIYAYYIQSSIVVHTCTDSNLLKNQHIKTRRHMTLTRHDCFCEQWCHARKNVHNHRHNRASHQNHNRASHQNNNRASHQNHNRISHYNYNRGSHHHRRPNYNHHHHYRRRRRRRHCDRKLMLCCLETKHYVAPTATNHRVTSTRCRDHAARQEVTPLTCESTCALAL